MTDKDSYVVQKTVPVVILEYDLEAARYIVLLCPSIQMQTQQPVGARGDGHKEGEARPKTTKRRRGKNTYPFFLNTYCYQLHTQRFTIGIAVCRLLVHVRTRVENRVQVSLGKAKQLLQLLLLGLGKHTL